MNTATHLAGNEQIEALIERFGPQLQEMSLSDRALLRIALAQYSFGLRFAQYKHGYTLTGNAVEDCLLIDEDGDWVYDCSDEDLSDALEILEGISADATDDLIEVITAQIRNESR